MDARYSKGNWLTKDLKDLSISTVWVVFTHHITLQKSSAKLDDIILMKTILIRPKGPVKCKGWEMLHKESNQLLVSVQRQNGAY